MRGHYTVGRVVQTQHVGPGGSVRVVIDGFDDGEFVAVNPRRTDENWFSPNVIDVKGGVVEDEGDRDSPGISIVIPSQEGT